MIHAAVASRDLTPAELGMPLQGHWCENNRARGVLAPLEVRAVAFGNDRDRPHAAIVTIDAIGITRDLTARVRTEVLARCGIAHDALMIACSHTHCAPAVLPCLGLQPHEPFVESVYEAAVDAAVEAVRHLEPVTLALGCGEARFNVNRRPRPGSTAMAPNFDAPVDHRVRVLRFDRARGSRASPLAVLFHYACHPTAKSGRDGLISPDYPGLARRTIESQLRCSALFLQGCCGNIRPLIVDDRGEFTSATVEQLDRCARELAAATCVAAERATASAHDSLAAAQRDVAFSFAPPRNRDELEAMSREQTPIARDITAPWADRVLQRIDAGTIPASETSLMQAMRIGPLRLMAIPAEAVLEIGQRIEALAPDIWPIGYANDMLGYFCTAEQYRRGGYEPTAYPFFDRPAPFVDEQRVTVECAAELLRDLEQPARVVAE